MTAAQLHNFALWSAGALLAALALLLRLTVPALAAADPASRRTILRRCWFALTCPTRQPQVVTMRIGVGLLALTAVGLQLLSVVAS